MPKIAKPQAETAAGNVDGIFLKRSKKRKCKAKKHVLGV
jgi:hypothetical protein